MEVSARSSTQNGGKKNSKIVTNVMPATSVTRVEVTPYATYLCKTWITYIGVAKAKRFTKKDAISILVNRLGLLLSLLNISIISIC